MGQKTDSIKLKCYRGLTSISFEVYLCIPAFPHILPLSSMCTPEKIEFPKAIPEAKPGARQAAAVTVAARGVRLMKASSPRKRAQGGGST